MDREAVGINGGGGGLPTGDEGRAVLRALAEIDRAVAARREQQPSTCVYALYDAGSQIRAGISIRTTGRPLPVD